MRNIDLLWMDVQGAELIALQGLKTNLPKVSLIHIEIELIEIYSAQPPFSQVRKFLEENEFRLFGFTGFHLYSGDAIFANNCSFSNRQLRDVENLLVPARIVFVKTRLTKARTYLKRFLRTVADWGSIGYVERCKRPEGISIG